MIYDYKCSFGHEFEIIESISEYIEGPRPCQFCEAAAVRHYKKPPMLAIPNSFKADYYPSLGKVFETKKDLDYHLDKNNMVAVGNDFNSGDSMQKHFEATREKEKQKMWENNDI